MSRSKRKPAKVKFPKSKVFGRIAIAAYLVYQLYIFIKYGSGQNALDGEFSSALAPLLSEFKGVSTANDPHQSVGNAGNTFTTFETGRQRDAKEASRIKDYNNPLERDFSRIPGYLEGSNDPSLFGYVMRDLANRFLRPSSPQQKRRHRGQFSPSNILVVSPGAPELLEKIKKKKPTTIASKKELIKSFGYRVGESFLIESVFHGHNSIAIDSNEGLTRDHWSKVTDVTLAILDPAQGQEDSVLSSWSEEYIRAGTIQFATFRVSSSILRANQFDNLATKMQGIKTCKKFLQAGYKLQVLSSSHAPTDGLNPYGPNTLLKNVENVQGFLRFGAGLAQTAQDIHHSKHTSGHLTLPSKVKEIPATFQSILFATRGLDLAIPSRKAFLNLTAHGSDFALDVEKDGVPYTECPRSFMAAKETEDDTFEISCFGMNLAMQESERRRIDDGNNTIVVELWHSHNDLSLSEAVCFKCTKSTMDVTKPSDSDSVCINRIRSTKMNSSNRSGGKSRGPNLLAIELKGVNQDMLKSSLGHLRNTSGSIGLDYFPNFAPSATISNPNDDQKWWTSWDKDILEDGGYQRYCGSNQCDLSSQSSSDDPALFHGSQMGRMFCFDYDRPNCIGGLHAATHLLSHVKKFISQNQEAKKRWASYVTLIDGVEETETLAGGLDLPLGDFLSEIKAEMTSEAWSNTVIATFSNDVQKPVLFLKTNNGGATGLLKKQKALFTSDLHLMVRSMLNDKDLKNAMSTGTVPDHTNMPARQVEPEGHDEHRFSEGELEAPPSVLSFYADIPKEHKFQLIKPYPGQLPKRAKPFQGCNCTTDEFPWIPCDFHPWDRKGQNERETYIIFACPGEPLHLETNVIPYKRLLKRSLVKRIQSSSDHLNNTNIIFLELDSVSQEYADRHFPKTRELLEKYRIKRNGENKFECTDGFCSAEFPYTALVGANSVPNQVAALSGCITSTTQELCGLNVTTVIPGAICNDSNAMHYGFRLDRLRRIGDTAYWCPNRDQEITKTPWIFGVSDSKGYINFFGEEFCYDYSPYVTQANVFPAFYLDIQSHKVFCSLVERKIATEEKLATMHRKHWWGVDLSDPCLDGYACPPNSEKASISLQFIKQVWNAYESQPKLAFLNAMAAHDYSADWEMMIPRAEVYDEHIHNFLESMLSRTDSQHTVIFLRSDHGLQKGPMSMDYSLQVEHRHPWTEILVPENLIVSKEALFNNQGRMLTGYDFYKTMRLLMSDRSNPRNVGEGIPDWSFDVLAEEISPQRKCEEAKIDSSLCPHVKQTRQYGVCNRLDPDQARFCEMER